MTASHNPGGPENDFGIKYNSSNGGYSFLSKGPASEQITDAIYESSKSLMFYKSTNLPFIDVSVCKSQTFEIKDESTSWKFTVEVVDSVSDYVVLMKGIFDFELIKKFLENNAFNLLMDCMNGGF